MLKLTYSIWLISSRVCEYWSFQNENSKMWEQTLKCVSRNSPGSFNLVSLSTLGRIWSHLFQLCLKSNSYLWKINSIFCTSMLWCCLSDTLLNWRAYIEKLNHFNDFKSLFNVQSNSKLLECFQFLLVLEFGSDLGFSGHVQCPVT